MVSARFAERYVGDVVISAVTLAELEYGVECSGEARGRNRAALDAFVELVPAVPFDGASARACGPVRLATRERRRDALYKLIAAHALALGVTPVTNNEADFAAYPGLTLENWVRHSQRVPGCSTATVQSERLPRLAERSR